MQNYTPCIEHQRSSTIEAKRARISPYYRIRPWRSRAPVPMRLARDKDLRLTSRRNILTLR